MRPRAVGEGETKSGEEKRPAGLSRVQSFGSAYVFQVFVVCPNQDGSSNPLTNATTPPRPASPPAALCYLYHSFSWLVTNAERKKAQGWSFFSEADLWDRMAPTRTSEAFASTINLQSGSSIWRIGAEVNLDFSVWKATTGRAPWS